MNWVLELARPEIRGLRAYQHAAWEPQLERLHANESPWRVTGDSSAAGLNRYPEPQPPPLVQGLAALYGVRPEMVLVGRGSDEAIDVLMRIFCRAGRDRVIVCPPTFGMYAVAARIQGADVVTVPLLAARGFELDIAGILKAVDGNTRLVFVCSPNNPTGNLVPREQLLDLAARLAPRALLVVDEAYIEFARTGSLAGALDDHPNLVVLRTLSKAYALAGARCGAVLAHPEITAMLARIIQPYAIPGPTIDAAMEFTSPTAVAELNKRIGIIREERERLITELGKLAIIRRVHPSEGNFLLLDCTDAEIVLNAAIQVGLIIRDQRSQKALPTGVRISIGTPEQNSRLLQGLQQPKGVAA